jgi:hypothetical protein
MGLREYEFVRNVLGKRIRVYAGHSMHHSFRAWKWHTGETTGYSVVPWGYRAFGIQWRPTDGT